MLWIDQVGPAGIHAGSVHVACRFETHGDIDTAHGRYLGVYLRRAIVWPGKWVQALGSEGRYGVGTNKIVEASLCDVIAVDNDGLRAGLDLWILYPNYQNRFPFDCLDYLVVHDDHDLDDLVYLYHPSLDTLGNSSWHVSMVQGAAQALVQQRVRG